MSTTAGRRTNKYGVAPKAERTYNGVVYHSKMEMLCARELSLAVTVGEISDWERQKKVQLGPDFHTVVDFYVVPFVHNGGPYYVEVKGMETPAFRRVRKLWKKYATRPLFIKKRKGNAWTMESIWPDGITS